MRIDNYEFSETCLNFLRDIETDYGKQLLIVEKCLKEAEHGFAKFENGNPTIEINEKEPYKIDVILHEAYHLKLKIEGMPNIGFELPNGINTESNRMYLDWFAHLFWDKITHHYFYRLFDQNLDISPFEPFKVEINNVIDSGEIKGLSVATKEISLAGYLLQVWIETNDLEYVGKFKSFLETKYNSNGIDKGEALIKIINDNPALTFDNCIDLFILVFDYLHKEQGISIKEYRKESIDNERFTENFVIFKLL